MSKENENVLESESLNNSKVYCFFYELLKLKITCSIAVGVYK